MREEYSFRIGKNVYTIFNEGNQKFPKWILDFNGLRRRVLYIGDYTKFIGEISTNNNPIEKIFNIMKKGLNGGFRLDYILRSSITDPSICLGKSIVFIPEESFEILLKNKNITANKLNYVMQTIWKTNPIVEVIK